jgi:hypothetical protein
MQGKDYIWLYKNQGITWKHATPKYWLTNVYTQETLFRRKAMKKFLWLAINAICQTLWITMPAMSVNKYRKQTKAYIKWPICVKCLFNNEPFQLEKSDREI